MARLHPQRVDPAEDARIEFFVDAHRVVDPRAPFHQAEQDLVEVGDRERVVRAVGGDGAFRSGARPVPILALAVALAHEQQVLALRSAGCEHRDRVGLREAGEVVEIAVLPVRVLDVAVTGAHRRGRQDRDRVAPERAHQLRATAAEFLTLHAGTRYVQCNCRLGENTCARSGCSSSNTTCAATRMNSTSSA
jgi:hypothetical protein